MDQPTRRSPLALAGEDMRSVALADVERVWVCMRHTLAKEALASDNRRRAAASASSATSAS